MIKITIEANGDISDLIAREIAEKKEEVLLKMAHAVRDEWEKALTSDYASYGLEHPQPGFARGLRLFREDEDTYVIGCYMPYSSWMKYQESDLDYKQTHPYGNKSRVSKDGTPYLIIPFRRFTPNAGREYQRMTGGDFGKAKKLSISTVTNDTYSERNAKGESIQRRVVEWGSRLKNAENANDKGMVAVYGIGGKKREYYTFRVISAKSSANRWIRKARPTILDQLEKRISFKDII